MEHRGIIKHFRHFAMALVIPSLSIVCICVPSENLSPERVGKYMSAVLNSFAEAGRNRLVSAVSIRKYSAFLFFSCLQIELCSGFPQPAQRCERNGSACTRRLLLLARSPALISITERGSLRSVRNPPKAGCSFVRPLARSQLS